MHKHFLLFIIGSFVSFSSLAFAEESTIPLDFSPEEIQDACRTPKWKGMTVLWRGVKDVRSDKALGTQTQKGKEPVRVFSREPLEKIFDRALKNLFVSCGAHIVQKRNPNAVELSVEIREFYADVQKKFLTGKGNAKSQIAFTGSRNGTSTTVDVGFEMDLKKGRQGSIGQLEVTINELLNGTLKAIASNTSMQELK